MTPIAEEYATTEVATTDYRLHTPYREVFVATTEASTSENLVDRYLNDISDDEVTADSPADETTNAKNAQRTRNQKRAERRRWLREALPICNLNNTLDEVSN